MRLYEMELAGETVAHAQHREHQVLLLPGRGEVIGKEGEIPLCGRDIVYVPPEKRHQFVNRGDEMLRLVVVLPIHQHATL
jgi:mannose-6-phosphate isomerase-like protein (cupin superfamily)